MQQINVSIKSTAPDLPLPKYETSQAVGVDLRAAVDEPVTLAPGERKLVPTGIRIALPPGYEAQVRGRSGLGLRHGISVVQGVGTIDSDYRGDVSALLINHGTEPFVISRGDRVAQIVINQVAQATFVQVDELDDTDRGEGGFGSTGVQ